MTQQSDILPDIENCLARKRDFEEKFPYTLERELDMDVKWFLTSSSEKVQVNIGDTLDVIIPEYSFDTRSGNFLGTIKCAVCSFEPTKLVLATPYKYRYLLGTGDKVFSYTLRKDTNGYLIKVILFLLLVLTTIAGLMIFV